LRSGFAPMAVAKRYKKAGRSVRIIRGLKFGIKLGKILESEGIGLSQCHEKSLRNGTLFILKRSQGVAIGVKKPSTRRVRSLNTIITQVKLEGWCAVDVTLLKGWGLNA